MSQLILGIHSGSHDAAAALFDGGPNAYRITFALMALATLIAIAPVMVVFLFAQRFLVSGMTAGGTKE